MIHRFMPIGREGWDVTEAVAAMAVQAGEMSRCGQCSHGNVTIYHDIPER